ncbi:MAG: thioredoxin-dependent thiol peroxidase [Gemmatimonadota bacterium]
MAHWRHGDPAPDFALSSDSGETIRLRDLRGRRVVLYVYPKDDTPGCTVEACGFRDRHDALDDARAVVLGVSPDDVASHVRFKAKYDLPFPLLADPDHRVASAYGAWGKKKMYGKEYEGVLRQTFVIDEQGKFLKVFDKVTPQGHAEEILQVLAT